MFLWTKKSWRKKDMQRFNIIKYTIAVILVCATVAISANERVGTLMVQLAFNSGYYSIENTWVVSEIYPIKKGASIGNDALIFQLTDSEGKEITRIKVSDPSIIRTPILPMEESDREETEPPPATIKNESGSIVLRLPQYEKARYINLLKPHGEQNLNGETQYRSNAIIKQQMDLLNY
jgi:hypothetical protein